jgi:serine/threonine-protein kinase RsbW
MTDSESANSTAESLTLHARLSELSKIPSWLDELASLYPIPERTRYAMDLCLEEVISNIIRHGHSNESSDVVKVSFLPDRNGFVALVVEDAAPPFNPLLAPVPECPRSLDEMPTGGQGIHLLKRFADAIEYESVPGGNRLIISFLRSEVARRN